MTDCLLRMRQFKVVVLIRVERTEVVVRCEQREILRRAEAQGHRSSSE